MHRMGDDLTRTVERLWQAFVHGGLPEVLDLVDEDVVWSPASAGGRVLRGRDELLAWDRESRESGRRVDAQVYALERRGDAVLVSAHLRVRDDGHDAARPVYWVYRFTDGRLRRAEAFETRAAALATLP